MILDLVGAVVIVWTIAACAWLITLARLARIEHIEQQPHGKDLEKIDRVNSGRNAPRRASNGV